jgi:hypothetical protein
MWPVPGKRPKPPARRGSRGLPLNDLTQVQPQRAPEQLTLVERRVPCAFRKQRAELLVQPD